MPERSIDKNRRVTGKTTVTANDALISDDSDDDVIVEMLTLVASQCGTDQGLVALFEPCSQRFVIRSSIGFPKNAVDEFASLRAGNTD